MIRLNRTTISIVLAVGAACVVLLMVTVSGSFYENRNVDIKSLELYKQSYGHENKVTFTASKTPKGKTAVYRHNGQELERLQEFCTWTLPLDCASLKTPEGPVTIYIHDVEDDPGLSGILKKTGIRDPVNVNIVINELKKYPDAGFFDFGSHIGVYALSIAHTLGRQVVSIDPMVENMVRLCKSIQMNGLTDKMSIVFNAISNDNKKVTFNRIHNHIGATTVLKSSDGGKSECEDSENYAVKLDDIIPIVPFKTAVMKLDVEKSEYFAVQGGQRFLQEINVPSILMEWYNIVQTPHARPLVDLMKQLKYVPYLPFVNGKHKRLQYEDYNVWRKERFLLDILWMKEA